MLFLLQIDKFLFFFTLFWYDIIIFMKKKIFIIGNEAKEYALAKKLSEKHDIYITPSSDALKEFATCLDIRENNIPELLEFVMENDIDMTIATSKLSLEADVASIFSKNEQPIFAPTAGAAKIINDKAFAKKTLYRLRIPTPKFGIFDKQNMALDYIKNQKIPFVVKTNDNNSAVILTSENCAKNIVESIFIEKNSRIIIEDYIYGTPFSFYTITDGYKALPIGSSISYKHYMEGDGGQLTSGMGACVPNYKLSIDQEYYLMDKIIYPTLNLLENEHSPYLGILGINGIITEENKIYILGWQSFMQDSDCAPILETIDEDLYNLFESCIIGSFSDEVNNISINNLHAVSVVLNCKNKEVCENPITGIDNLNDDTIITFYPSVKKNKYLEFEAKNGNVLCITSTSSSIAKAAHKVYQEIKDINFNGIYYRKDICKNQY